MSYRDPYSGRFAVAPPPPRPKPRTWFRVVVEIGSKVTPRGPWQESRDAAMKDAIKTGLASYDRVGREYYLAVPVSIASYDSITRPAD